MKSSGWHLHWNKSRNILLQREFCSNEAKDIVNLVLFGKATHRKMIQNLMWATGYNVVALPLAAGVLYHWGIIKPCCGGSIDGS